LRNDLSWLDIDKSEIVESIKNLTIEYENMEDYFSSLRDQTYKILNPSIYNRDKKEESIPKFYKVKKIFNKF